MPFICLTKITSNYSFKNHWFFFKKIFNWFKYQFYNFYKEIIIFLTWIIFKIEYKIGNINRHKKIKYSINVLFLIHFWIFISFLYFCYQLLFSVHLSNRPIFLLFSFLYHHFLLYLNHCQLYLPIFVSFIFPFYQSYYDILNQRLILGTWWVCWHFIAILVQLNLVFYLVNKLDLSNDVLVPVVN